MPEARGVDRYEALYREFDSPLMRRVRRDAYGEDIGQHSWVAADDLRADIGRLGLTSSSRILDLGCGPCGPITFILLAAGCLGTGVELSLAALRVGRARSRELGVGARLTQAQADLNAPLPMRSRRFDAVMSLDVVLHLRDRLHLFHEVARVLRPGGRFLFTDAGVMTGPISEEEARRRSLTGSCRFVAPGWNERLLESAGFRLIETGNRSDGVLRNARGRLAAIRAHRKDLERVWSAAEFRRQQDYLEAVIELSSKGALSRAMVLAEI